MIEQPHVIQGSILDVRRGVLAHQVNCRGKMGAGLAKAIRDRWPRVFFEYRRKLESRGWRVGDCQCIQVEKDIWVANVAGQDAYGREPRLYTNYDGLRRGLLVAKQKADALGLPLYVPHGIGCGLAGGDWALVSDLLPSGTVVVRTACPGTN